MKLLLSFILLVVSVFVLNEGKAISTDKERADTPESSTEGAGLWKIVEEEKDQDSDDISSGDKTPAEEEAEGNELEEGSAVEAQTGSSPGKDVEEDAGKRDTSAKGKKRDCGCCEHEHGCHDCGHEHEHCCHDGCHHCHGEHHADEEGHHCQDCEHGYEKFEEWGDECGNDNSCCGHHNGCHEHCDHHDDHGHHEDCHGHHCCGHCKEEGGDD